MTDWKQAAITAGHNEAKARQAEAGANIRFWIVAAAFLTYIILVEFT